MPCQHQGPLAAAMVVTVVVTPMIKEKNIPIGILISIGAIAGKLVARSGGIYTLHDCSWCPVAYGDLYFLATALGRRMALGE